MLMQALDEAWKDVDVVVTPTFADGIVLATNLTGHPVVVAPSGFLPDRTPSSVSFLGRLWKDAEALHVAKAFQEATGHHLRRPPSFS
jgi:Asp-tRNA(Asn)/Glu-tRNA(Gln) amidotransferase A subunit family amidase